MCTVINYVALTDVYNRSGSSFCVKILGKRSDSRWQQHSMTSIHLAVGRTRPVVRPSHDMEANLLQLSYGSGKRRLDARLVAAPDEAFGRRLRRDDSSPFQPRNHHQIPALARFVAEAVQPRAVSGGASGHRADVDEALRAKLIDWFDCFGNK